MIIKIYNLFKIIRKFSVSGAVNVLDEIKPMPKFLKFIICDIFAFLIYYPLCRSALLIEKIGFDVRNFPLYSYRFSSFYVMRTDSRDRFGTPLEKRFTKEEIYKMMKQSGLEKINFKNDAPFWTAIGFKQN